MKKLILVLFCLGALSWGTYQVFPIFKSLYTFENGSPVEPDSAATPGQSQSQIQSTPDPSAPLRAMNVDAMASRMKKYQDVYQKLRDNSLAVYAKLHPVANPHDKEAATAIRLAAYLWVWGDFYEEGLRKTYVEYGGRIKGPPDYISDPLINMVSDIQYMSGRYCNNDQGIDDRKKSVESLDGTDYPQAFKFWGHIFMMRLLEGSKGYPELKQSMTRSFALLPEMAGRMVEQYKALYKERLPDYLFYLKGTDCLDCVENDAGMLTYTAAGIDKIFENEAPDSVVRSSLQGRFYVNYAWNARGSDWANTVSDEGWKLMRGRLLKASELLQNAAAYYPKEEMIAHNMMKVELGQGLGRDRMEKWFQVAIDADPDDWCAYEHKLVYLLPRWYGSNEEIWKFGLDCAKTQNWGARIPMVLVSAVEYVAVDSPKVYANAQIWSRLELVFQTYLQHYPESVTYRSKFAKYAAQGGHWEIARQQFSILGNEWDQNVFSNEEYAALKRDAEQNLKK